MKKALLISQYYFELIDNSQNGQDLLFIGQDGDNNWVVGIPNRNNLKFLGVIVDDNGVSKSVNQILNELPEIDFIPVPNENV